METQTFIPLRFKDEVMDELFKDFKQIRLSGDNINDVEVSDKLDKLILWLSTTPKYIVFRVNRLLCEQQVAIDSIKEALMQFSRPIPNISTFPNVEELIIVNSWKTLDEADLEKQSNEIIVDAACGAAVLRGAHVYAPGVLGMPKGLSFGERVSIYADFKQSCKKGLVKKYDNQSKLFIGNGIAKMSREQIFGHDLKNVSGIAVFMTSIISHVPQLNDGILPRGHILLQNLPSIICSRVLDPQPGEVVLDMCAAPGNKTTHIAALMKNEGTVIAVERIKSKLDKLILNIEHFQTKIVRAFCFDSTKAVDETKTQSHPDKPPFPKESFDRILLDGPCSALGQRPQIYNNINTSQLRSYVPLQRKLFSTSAELLKPGGTLVYSTCTITIAENEGIIAWALKKFPNLVLQSVRKTLKKLEMEAFSTVGYNIDGLSDDESNKLCRFGYEGDSVGFFIACFIKKHS